MKKKTQLPTNDFSAETVVSSMSVISTGNLAELSNRPLTAGPAAIVALLQAGAALVTIINGFKKSEYEENVARKLQMIYAVLGEILEELKSLRPWFERALDDAFRKQLEGTVYAKKQGFEIALSLLSPAEQRNPSKKTRDDFEKMGLAQAEHCFELERFGPLAYFGIVAGAFSTISIWTFSRASKEGVRKFIEKEISWLKQAIEPGAQGSWGAVYERVKADADAKRGIVNGAPNNVWLGYFSANFVGAERGEPREPRDPDRRPARRYVNYYGARSGDFDSGIHYTSSHEVLDDAYSKGYLFSPNESSQYITQGHEGGRARAENLGRLYNEHHRAPGLSLEAHAAEVLGHIEAIRKAIVLLEEIARKYK